MSGLTDDWDSIPVKETKSSSNGLTDDWDSVPVNTKQSPMQASPMSPGKEAGQRIAQEGSEWWNQFKSGNIKALPIVGVGEAGLNAATGIGSSIIGGLAGGARTLYNLATGEGLDKSTQLGNQTVQTIQNAGTYQPRTAGGKLMTDVVNTPMAAVSEATRSTGGDVGQVLGNREAGEAVGQVVPSVVGTLAGGKAALDYVRSKQSIPTKQPIPIQLQTPDVTVSDVPAYLRKDQPGFGQMQRGETAEVAAPQSTQQSSKIYTPPTLEDTPPEFQQIAKQRVNDAALQRHVEAQALPVPIQLTEGQATLNPTKISEEMNGRGKGTPSVSPDFFNAQGKQLGQNLQVMRQTAAPDVIADNPTDHGQVLIDQYKAMDAPIVENINAKYQALRDANGGQFPVDAKTLYDNIQNKLSSELLTYDAPQGQLSAIKNMAENGGNMTFEQFLNLRRNLGNISRTSQDGNMRAAAGAMVNELEKLPLSGGAEQLQPLAQAARQAAKARFDALDADPAYKAAVSDDIKMGAASPLADKFVDKYIVGGRRADIQQMRNNLSNFPLADQTMKAATLDALKNSAKVDVDTGKFNAQSYNSTVEKLRPKLNDLIDQKTANQVQQLGNVSKYVTTQPRGSFVNNSNTLVGALAGGAGELAQGVLNAKTMGVSGFIKNRIDVAKQQKAMQQSIEPAAGTTKLKDFPQ